MNNTCVMCNNPEELPEGTHICPRCQNGSHNDGVLCPNCGTILDVMHSHWSFTGNGLMWSSVFHCNVCHSDWEKEAEYIAKPVIFKRKYWG